MPQVLLKTVLLLILSNCFMTFAWYGHLRTLSSKPWIIAVLISWGVAFFEYLVQVPANRIGHDGNLSLAQLKIIQEVVTVSVFIPFLIFFMGEKWKWDYLWALLCMIGAVYFVNRSNI